MQMLLIKLLRGVSAPAALLMTATMSACVDIEGPVSKPLAPDQILASVRINRPAVMMQLADTLDLDIIATALNDAPISVNPEKLRWISKDPSQVTVDSLGRVVGLTETPVAVEVIASYTHERTTKADTIPIVVTATRLDATGIKLVAVDSNKVGIDGLLQPRVRVDLYQGETLVMKGVQIPLRAPKPVALTFSLFGGPDEDPVYSVDNRGYIGKFWINASTDLYGVEVADSIEFTGVYSSMAAALWLLSDEDGNFLPNEMPADQSPPLVQPCALVIAVVFTPRVLDLVFSDSTASSDGCGPIPPNALEIISLVPLGLNGVGGNLLNMPPYSVVVRRSNTKGVVSFYARDAVTKERLPISRRYEVADPPQ